MQVAKVGRALQFVGSAVNKDNVEGNPSFNKLVIYDDFVCTTLDATNDYTVTIAATADSATINAQANGVVRLTSGSTDDNVAFLASSLIFDMSKNPVIEARVSIIDVSKSCLFFGFSMATNDTTPEGIIDADSATIARGTAITDAAGFVCDADKVTSTLYIASTKTSGAIQSAAVTPSTLWTDGQWKVLRVALDSTGNAYFWVDGVLAGIIKLAVADVPFCFVVACSTRDGSAAQAVDIDYFKSWQDR
jgi:hypothetical protein